MTQTTTDRERAPDDVRGLIERLHRGSDNLDEACNLCDEAADALERLSTPTSSPVAGEGDEIKRLRGVIERDRSRVAEVMTAVRKAIAAREWLRLGRGSYEWDDDRWKDEFGAAIDEIEAALEPARTIARDKTDCPTTTEEVMASRASRPPEPAASGERPEAIAEKIINAVHREIADEIINGPLPGPDSFKPVWIKHIAAALTRPPEGNARVLRELLAQAKGQFAFYAHNHRDKARTANNDLDRVTALAKAQVNEAWVERIEKALALPADDDQAKRIRAEAIEECAKVADKWQADEWTAAGVGPSVEIRALSPAEPASKEAEGDKA